MAAATPGIAGLPVNSIVTTGTLTTAQPIAIGETWRMDCSGLSSLSPLEISLW
jgi:hypothetical protein